MMTTKEIITDVAPLFGTICGLCHKEYDVNGSWVIHHAEYVNGEKTSNDFKFKTRYTITKGKNKGKQKTKIIYFKTEYHNYIYPIVKTRPESFRLLHHKCHQAVTRLVRWKKDNRKRLCELAMEMP